MTDEDFLREAIRLAREGMHTGQGGPFGSVVVKDGQIVGRGSNQVTSTNDPTAHAEVVAIRDACRNLGTFQLEGCTLYASCEPCPMCLGAIYWARPDRIVYGAFHSDAAKAGFDDQFIYEEIEKPREQRHIPMTQLLRDEADAVFQEWQASEGKTLY
ncbi:CMP/dCMP deaminase zinc-binding protein [Fibrisoma limi BUZ 3]|uniref:CMP/dCMP deaminase zinc-binding protein n=1 Tax=Fibrisoma limi BUZ 3 TaxID=1185876 RepID=I2GEJ1_9BACT|nr:nucleoside deaminase [Fibrisoma limi]CCH52316.1 CMP/dCMP deaminase zinc-binding protein [Fibrisoma limi BUZ 3]